MALNYAMLSPARMPIPLPNECTVTTIDNGVEIILIIPDAPPAGSSRSGGIGGTRKLKDVGRLVLTDQRLIFVSANESKSVDTLSIHLTDMLSTKFEQPLLGTNYLAVDIKPAPEGGLTEGTRAEMRFKDKGLFSFVSVLEKTRERAVYMKRQIADEGEGLPSYSADDAGPSGYADTGPSAYTGASPSAYADAPPGYDD
ncbi:hypothetical protein WOLCODRAFT_162548 [Wolfiporia cocos MD-104 SS10]|uniref:GRAM domain-containing protein n=1 Tax=Wolfiporia cocos (strain MD-104) TaxID=742152 RepID=A0A2H3JPR5_WOLCO|nr:hypothetical protein WOLCODRAFT_162548 [Wolfiporia cocos MD-104 SS10]